MDYWFIYALIAMFAFGWNQTLFKVPAAKGYSKFTYSTLGFIMSALLSLVVFWGSISFDRRAMGFALIWGITYTLFSILTMNILKRLDTSESFPTTSLGSQVLVIMIGILFFKDTLSPLQIFALILTVFLIAFYNHTNKHITFNNGLISIALGIASLSAFSKFIQKYGAISSDVYNFIFWELFFGAIFAACVLYFNKNKKLNERPADRKLLLWAILLGATNFIGTAAMVKALSTGPFSLVYTINSFYILVSSVVAWKLFGEKLTKQKLIFICLAIITIILIKIG